MIDQIALASDYIKPPASYLLPIMNCLSWPAFSRIAHDNFTVTNLLDFQRHFSSKTVDNPLLSMIICYSCLPCADNGVL